MENEPMIDRRGADFQSVGDRDHRGEAEKKTRKQRRSAILGQMTNISAFSQRPLRPSGETI